MNERESEAISSVLQKRGFDIVTDEHSADIVLLNTCSVREQAELKAIGKSNLVARDNKLQILGILGCMAQNLGEQLLKLSPHVRLIVGPTGLAKIPEYIDYLLTHPKEHIIDTNYSAIDSVFASAHDLKQIGASAYVSIMQGCNMRCAYCIVPKTRGPECYRPIDAILEEIQKLAEHGVKEITLLGQIVNNYGFKQIPIVNGKSPFVQLLEKIQTIDGIERIRFTSPHPKGFKSDLIDAYRDLSKLCPYVHLPLQSGSNKILRAMKRPYTQEQFLDIIAALRDRVPTISISTDIIVGFPGEDDADFEATCKVFDAVKFDMAYIFKYSIRPGTEAAQLGDQIATEIKEARNQILLKKLEKYSQAYNDAMIGKTYKVLVDGHARKGIDRFEGRTPEHKKVIFLGKPDQIGQIVDVTIERATSSTLEGTLNDKSISSPSTKI